MEPIRKLAVANCASVEEARAQLAVTAAAEAVTVGAFLGVRDMHGHPFHVFAVDAAAAANPPAHTPGSPHRSSDTQ